MFNLNKNAQKWAKRWEQAKIFEPEIDPKKKKYFVNAPYPYVNGYAHIGHLYTNMRIEACARFKRLMNFNVLFPMGYHCTGSPIVSAAQRVAEKEPKQIAILESMGFDKKEIEKFKDPVYWTKVFPKAWTEDLKELGFSIDFRRSFITTNLNPYYDKFIRWQFRTLKEKGLVMQGSHPVVWDPVEKTPIGDHDRAEGEGETPKDFIWAKFQLDDSDLILMAGTTRPDALYGQTNLWIDPNGDYVVVKVKNEKWVVGKDVLEKIEDQYAKPKVLRSITPKELIGKWVKGPIVKHKLYILPASFIDSSVGSGIVYSALEDPVDLLELHQLQSDKETIQKWNLDEKVVKKLKPIFIIKVPGMGENLGEDIAKEYNITSYKDTAKLEKAKGELNKRVFRKGVMNATCGVCKGKAVPEAQEYLKGSLVKKKEAIMFYELSGRVVSRHLNECTVKMVRDQWFIDYKDSKWKAQAHKALKSMKLYPEVIRDQFTYVIDWLHAWACAREKGLGTQLPFDEDWVIESLSDSTIYMAYYTIAHLIKKFPIAQVTDALFDYVLLGKGKAPNNKIEAMRKEFDYWYPVDVRSSGKDLIQNHLTFFLFNHTAMFPLKHWPKAMSANGWVTVDGQKMSKSKGNMILLRDLVKKYGVDASRLTILSGGEGIDDANWDSSFAETVNGKLEGIYTTCTDHYNKGRTGKKQAIDTWMENQLNSITTQAINEMEQMQFRSAIQLSFFTLQRKIQWYLRRTQPNKQIINKAIETQLLLLSPFTPAFCEEVWESIGKKGFISSMTLPKPKQTKDVIDTEFVIEQTLKDIHALLKLLKLKTPKHVTLFVAPDWKYPFLTKLKESMKTHKDIGTLMKKLIGKDNAKETSKLIQYYIRNPAKMPDVILTQKDELAILEEAKPFLEKTFGCSVSIENAKDSSDPKAQQAMPSKVAIKID